MIQEIRKKHLLDLSETELRIRCSYDEKYIEKLENKIKALEFKIKQMEGKERDNERSR